MSCDNSLTALLKRGDKLTIAILAGTGAGGIIIGVLLTILIGRLTNRRRSPPPSTPTVQLEVPRGRSKTIPVERETYEEPPNSAHSLSGTFVRHSLKPPINMFDTRGRAEWQALNVHMPGTSKHGYESVSSSTSMQSHSRGGSPDTRPDSLKVAAANILELQRRRSLAASGPEISRSWSESTMYGNGNGNGSLTDLAALRTGLTSEVGSTHGVSDVSPPNATKVRAATSAGRGRLAPELGSGSDRPPIGLSRAKSDPRVPQTGREKTQYDVSTSDYRRKRTYSSPHQPEVQPVELPVPYGSNPNASRSSISVHRIVEGDPRSQLRSVKKPPLTITRPEDLPSNDQPHSSLPFTGSTIPDGSGRQSVQGQAVNFYGDQASRHLSMPYGGPLSSTVLPDSPGGAIGGEMEMIPKRSAPSSFARGMPY